MQKNCLGRNRGDKPSHDANAGLSPTVGLYADLHRLSKGWMELWTGFDSRVSFADTGRPDALLHGICARSAHQTLSGLGVERLLRRAILAQFRHSLRRDNQRSQEVLQKVLCQNQKSQAAKG